jgi:hypothetical protein
MAFVPLLGASTLPTDLAAPWVLGGSGIAGAGFAQYGAAPESTPRAHLLLGRCD